MAKKHFQGYKGKTSARIIATGVTAGVISLAIIGGTVANKIINRPTPEHPYNDSYISDNNFVQEPNIDMEAGYDDFTPDPILPDLNQPIIPDNNDNNEELGVEFVEVLAKLTNRSKDYITSVTGTAPNLTISGLTSMNINSNKNEIVLLGQVKVGDNFNHFIATMSNINNGLKIYNLSGGEISETEFINALDELVSSESTDFKLQLKQYISLSNATSVINNILQSRLGELTALNSTDKTVLDEISHLNNLLKNSENLKLNVLLNSRQTTDNGYNYSFNISVNTGKYVYSSDLEVGSNRVLTTSALKHTIEEYLSVNTDYAVNSITSTSINNALYLISNTAFNLQNSAPLNK